MQQWKNKRLKGIGGSDASAILGLNPYMTNQDLWKIKTGRKIPEDISNKEVVKYGVACEPILIDLFKLEYPTLIVNYKDYDIRYNKDYNFIFGSLDAEVINEENKKGILEIKTATINNSTAYANWKDKVPTNYYLQVLHYLLTTEFEFAYIYALLRFQDELKIKKYEIQRKDKEEEIKYLLEKELEFWKCVEEDREPDLILPII